MIDCGFQLAVRFFVRFFQPRYFACKFFAQFTKVSVDYCIRIFVRLFRRGKFAFDIRLISVNRFSQIVYRFIEVRLYLIDCGFQPFLCLSYKIFEPRYFVRKSFVCCRYFPFEGGDCGIRLFQILNKFFEFCIKFNVGAFERGDRLF